MKKHIFFALPLAAFLLSCADNSNFQGNSKQAPGAASAAKSEDKDQNPEPAPSEPADKEAAPAPSEDVKSADPIPDAEPAPEGAVNTDNGIEFGANEVFRIGDGNASASTCLEELDAFNLSGTNFFFEFSVEEDDTEIDITVGKVCGVDYQNANFVALVESQGEKTLARSALARSGSNDGQSPALELKALKLNKGTYAIEVSSGRVFNDRDDFLVGNIGVKANKTVKALRIFAE